MEARRTPNSFVAAGPKRVIGMVHLMPMPGSPFYVDGSLDETCARAVRDAVALDDGGADGCLIQTVDGVYRLDGGCDPASVSAVTLICRSVLNAVRPSFLVGVQMMPNAVKEALAVARLTGAHFVRATAHIGATSTQWGTIQGDPYAVMAYKDRIGARDVDLIVDISTQHFSWVGAKAPVERLAKWAKEAGADAVCLGHPDEAVMQGLAHDVRLSVPDLPIVLSGHTRHDNAKRLLVEADGVLVGTCFQSGGWSTSIDQSLVREYMQAIDRVPS